ncbi:MAG: DUF6457 domain-containing protein [Cellulomonadaceae bacterium]|jgi:hypothetical protein|nr:DUF6457 domain-containing protein [Cellulomonadaceae bacterium]
MSRMSADEARRVLAPWITALGEHLGIPADAVDVEGILELAAVTSKTVARPAVPVTGYVAGYAAGYAAASAAGEAPGAASGTALGEKSAAAVGTSPLAEATNLARTWTWEDPEIAALISRDVRKPKPQAEPISA